jgi:hypothetical protein
MLPITLGSPTLSVKLFIFKHLFAVLILGFNYLYHLNAVTVFDSEVLRLLQRTTGMQANVPFTNIEQQRIALLRYSE